jgi:hypothetical protein
MARVAWSTNSDRPLSSQYLSLTLLISSQLSSPIAFYHTNRRNSATQSTYHFTYFLINFTRSLQTYLQFSVLALSLSLKKTAHSIKMRYSIVFASLAAAVAAQSGVSKPDLCSDHSS